MSYVYSQQYKCIKCSYEFAYSPDEKHSAPVFSKDVQTPRGTYLQSLPVCPKCFEEFVMKNMGIGYCTVNWTGISDYDKEKSQ